MPLFEEQFFSRPGGIRLRYGWFNPPTPARGTVLCLGGRREFIEKDFEVIEAWLTRGFQVIAMDWRGQGGSSRALPNPHKGYVKSFGDYREDLNAFYRSLVKPQQKGPLIVFGHSMGAFIALDWILHDKPGVRAAILVTPMLALPAPTSCYGFMTFITRCAIKLGFGNVYTPGEKNYRAEQWPFENNALTHDPVRYKIIPDWFAKRPEFAVGGVTYAWLDEALKAIKRLRKQLKNIAVPVLALNAGADRVVLSNEISRWAKEIPAVTEKIYPDALHDLMCEADDYLAQVWRDIDAFLKPLIP